ncbi:hypothetical protein [Dictyobacter formicarum]|uniref:hypothetical protein n=1 Tax=Dictyobacter formicarum TaxID=2778368 RepID=UPI001915B98A|nr:hypothetical protein [Dictyobacter formicarum]
MVRLVVWLIYRFLGPKVGRIISGSICALFGLIICFGHNVLLGLFLLAVGLILLGLGIFKTGSSSRAGAAGFGQPQTFGQNGQPAYPSQPATSYGQYPAQQPNPYGQYPAQQQPSSPYGQYPAQQQQPANPYAPQYPAQQPNPYGQAPYGQYPAQSGASYGQTPYGQPPAQSGAGYGQAPYSQPGNNAYAQPQASYPPMQSTPYEQQPRPYPEQ